jgi:hypothetical protein
VRAAVLVLALAIPSVALSAADEGAPPYLDELLRRAWTLRLAQDKAWLRLGHWNKTPVGWKSEADGPQFFRSPRGKTDPTAELEETLRGFFDARPVTDELDDAQCRFPARFAFLAARLDFDSTRLKPRPCPRRDEFLARIQARSATVVFSSYYLNNPSSSFGHTFLRLNKAEEARPEKSFELLDHGVDYSATVDTGNALVYAFKGLFGLFHGAFLHYAYYYKVREYADAESRDLWEYDLALTPAEVAMLAGHIWELGGTWFDYWYLDENCSYHVLGALEAAAPRFSLVEHVGAVVLPSDTVKALFRNPGLVRAVHYRPSIRTQFAARAATLDDGGRALLDALAADPAAPLPDDMPAPARAAALDAAVDLLDLRFGRDLVVGKAPEAARARQVLLERRSAIPVQSPELEIDPPLDRAPERGHGSFRLGAGGGYSSRDGEMELIDVRIALHDLGDPPLGYPSLAQIEFAPIRLRLAFREPRADVDEAWLVRIVSLNDLSHFDLRPSWRVKVGAATVRDGACRSCLAGQGELGAGYALESVARVLDLYAGADVAVEWSPHLSGIGGSELRAGVGPGGLARLRLGTRAALLADARYRFLPGADPGRTWDLGATLRLHLPHQLSLALEARRTPAEDVLSAALFRYF